MAISYVNYEIKISTTYKLREKEIYNLNIQLKGGNEMGTKHIKCFFVIIRDTQINHENLVHLANWQRLKMHNNQC